MSQSVYASRKGSSVGEDMTSGTSSGFAEDFSFRPDTAPGKARDKLHPISPLAASERSRSVPLSMRLPGRYTNETQGRMSAREFLQSAKTDITTNTTKSRPESKTAQSKMAGSPENDQPWYVSMLREKEERLLRMGDEINRLMAVETEMKQKEAEISNLKRQVAQHAVTTTAQEDQNDAIVADLKSRIQILGDEIVRIGVFEEECKKKDEVIQQMQEKLDCQEKELASIPKFQIEEPAVEVFLPEMDGRSTAFSERQLEAPSENSGAKDAFDRKVESLRQSVRSATADVDSLKEEFDELVPEKLTPEDEVIVIRDELAKKTRLVELLKQKLEEAHKELAINEGFAHALQRDLQLSENKAVKMITQVEKSEAKMKEAVAEARALSKKFSDLRESRKRSDIVAQNEHELNLVNEALREAQARIDKLREKTEKQSKEIRDSHRKLKKANELDKKQSEEIKNLCKDLDDIRQREQLSRVVAEQTSSRFERLRSRIIQAVYITPGAAFPGSAINDAVVFNAIKKIIDDRSEFHQKISETDADFPPLQIEIDTTQEAEKVDELTPSSTIPDRKSGKGGRKSPKYR